MAFQTLPVSRGEVLSINQELSIPVGTEMDVVNESILYNAYLQESSTEPAASTVNMRSLTQRDWPDSRAYVQVNSEEIWVYSPNGDITLSVQVIA